MTLAVPAEPQTEAKPPDPPKPVEIVDVAGDAGKTISFTKSFTMTWRNSETGHVKAGTFTVRRPTLGDLGRIAVLKAKMSGGEKLDAQTDFYNEMMASLQVVITDAPDWWAPADFFTADPLVEVWNHVRSWIDSFRSRRVG